jgi:hypothetical protein
MPAADPFPTSLTVELPLSPAYEDEHAQLSPNAVHAELDLGGGPRTFRSDPVRVGAYRGLDVHAQLSFSYDFDLHEGKLTIRGNDDRTAEQLRIATFLGGASDALLAQLPSPLFEAMPNDIGVNAARKNLWAAHVAERPDFAAALSGAARESNARIVAAAIEAGIPAVLEIGTPPLVTPDTLDDWKVAFGEEPGTALAGNPLAELLRVQFKVDSTYVGTVTWAANTQFANVIGSTQDPKVPGFTTWIQLWRDKCNGGASPAACSSLNYFSSDSAKKCSGILLGGHVILGTTAKSESKGATVYIYPICTGHNNTNNGYMKIINNPTGVQLSYW